MEGDHNDVPTLQHTPTVTAASVEQTLRYLINLIQSEREARENDSQQSRNVLMQMFETIQGLQEAVAATTEEVNGHARTLAALLERMDTFSAETNALLTTNADNNAKILAEIEALKKMYSMQKKPSIAPAPLVYKVPLANSQVMQLLQLPQQKIQRTTPSFDSPCTSKDSNEQQQQTQGNGQVSWDAFKKFIPKSERNQKIII
jgi:ABC-type transporter Mla subunit MlaD